jgi:hypothetical protein
MNAIYGIVTAIWLVIAILITIKIPQCVNVPFGNRIVALFVMTLAIVSSLYVLYELYIKTRLIETNTLINTGTTTATTAATTNAVASMSQNTVVSLIFTVFFIIIVCILYYLTLVTIVRCDGSVIPMSLFWTFIIVTIIQMLVSSLSRVKVDNMIAWNMCTKK